jgi:hypothetical protein
VEEIEFVGSKVIFTNDLGDYKRFEAFTVAE